VPSGGSLWRSRQLAPLHQKLLFTKKKMSCRVKIVKKDETMELTPERIVTENLKEAEHLASTWALYHLCRGQVSAKYKKAVCFIILFKSVHMLLPPPYRDVWLQWQSAERQTQEGHEEKENKVCFIYTDKS
jgi:ATP-dependent RNA helicase DHX29